MNEALRQGEALQRSPVGGVLYEPALPPPSESRTRTAHLSIGFPELENQSSLSLPPNLQSSLRIIYNRGQSRMCKISSTVSRVAHPAAPLPTYTALPRTSVTRAWAPGTLVSPSGPSARETLLSARLSPVLGDQSDSAIQSPVSSSTDITAGSSSSAGNAMNFIIHCIARRRWPETYSPPDPELEAAARRRVPWFNPGPAGMPERSAQQISDAPVVEPSPLHEEGSINLNFQSPVSALSGGTLINASTSRRSVVDSPEHNEPLLALHDISFRQIDAPSTAPARHRTRSEGDIAQMPDTPVLGRRRIYSNSHLRELRGPQSVLDHIISHPRAAVLAEVISRPPTRMSPQLCSGHNSATDNVTWDLACDPAASSPLPFDDISRLSLPMFGGHLPPFDLLRRINSDETEVRYDLCHNGTEYRVATFDWNCATPHQRLAFIEDQAQPLGGVLRVHLETCAVIGMNMVHQMVAFEIALARNDGRISGDVAECLWEGWLADGEEKMVVCMEPGESPVTGLYSCCRY
ncbi:unnamed protein product [Zymoseptoria tritici ST99CH_1A5]|uniref:Uncharacterized protein n=1 Tax=Zymoseptoria tritici ST99CH_1A5 TaxID=1276529 RepID=A0A1Y6L595_ZYMTR|nr:unnamed protein product [Zymoseptoria tritici ST99CH_3D1]SMY19515.1 unnamed protein product [Zymoseptoria tritici ST99CH_1A5]